MPNTVPTPRSFSQTLGDMVAVVQSRLGLPKLNTGSPVLHLLEAAAMSDLRAAADMFGFFTSSDLDAAEGEALDLQGQSEGRPRLQEAFASGPITVTDTRYTKIFSKIYAGLPAPLAGSTTIAVVDASEFSATGSVYIGRGTPNLEGPLEYTAKTNLGAYWTLTLDSGSHTRRYHNTGEGVVMAQGGNRTISAGAVAQTPQGGADSAQFSVLYSAVLPDGEVELEGVTVVAKTAGVAGNIPAGAINSFSSPPFTGAVCTNSAPYTNGRATEEDPDYREAIRAKRLARAGGTRLALPGVVLGLTSADENKRILSSSMVRRQGLPSTLYIDDGTGYEELSEGVAVEPLVDFAVGGELFFPVLGAPVAKASVTSTAIAPFVLAGGKQLAFLVGGVLSQHTFSASDFRNPAAATAFEVVASVNATPGLLFNARTGRDGTVVTCFAKDDTNDDIEAVTPDAADADANTSLLFPLGRRDTLALFQNDRLLLKDGRQASFRSQPFSEWSALSGDQTLTVAVDGTPSATYTFTSQDFVDADTGFSILGNNTLAAWAAVFNAIVPGTTSVVDGNSLVITSNIGRNARAKLEIFDCSLVEAGVFVAGEVLGAGRDYTFDRNTGDIVLANALAVGDRLSLGSSNTRGFVESDDIDPVTLSDTARLWLALDGACELLPTGIGPSTAFTLTRTDNGSWGARYTLTAAAGTPFALVEAGDWLVIWDEDASWDDWRGEWRVTSATDTVVSFETEDVGAGAGAVTFPNTGIAFGRYAGHLQKLEVPAAANRTADAFAETLDASIEGGAASTFQSDRLRLRTNTHGLLGDLGVLTVNTEGLKLLVDPTDAISSNESHVGSVESGTSEVGVPTFQDLSIDASPAADEIDVVGTGFSPELLVHGAKNTLIVSGKDRYGNNKDFRSSIESIVDAATSTLNLRKSVHGSWVDEDRLFLAAPYALGPEDELGVLADDDVSTKRFVAKTWRALRPVGVSYAATNAFKDIGDGEAPESYLATAFGTDFDFNDFAVFMRARAKSHSADATKATLWRYKRFGAEGEGVVVQHTYPAAPDLDIAVETEILPDEAEDEVRVSIVLPSNGQKTGYPLRNSSGIGYGYSLTGALGFVTLALGFPIASATRSGGNTVVLTLTLPTGLYNVTDHSIPNGSQIWVQSSSGSFPSGLKTITAVTTTTLTYVEAGANVTVASIGTVSKDTVGEATFAGATPSAITVGDLVHLGDFSAIPATWRDQTIKLTHVGTQFVQGNAEVNPPGATSETTLDWANIVDATEVKFYPLDAAGSTAALIAAAVNDIETSPVSATLLGAGGGTISSSSRDELVDADGGYALADGLNWVRATTNPPDEETDYELEFKEGVDGSLAADSDWDNEEVRIVPTTAKNVSDWLGSLAVSGIASVCDVETSDQARRVQISTQTLGSEGSVQVQGGTANEATSSVVGSSRTASGYLVATFPTSDLAPFRGQRWVNLDNSVKIPKDAVFESTTVLDELTTEGVFTLSAGSPAVYTDASAAQVNQTVQVERQGPFVAYAGLGAIGAAEGDWVYITTPTTPAANEISAANCGIFRIVRTSFDMFWIENDSVVEEAVVKCDVRFFTADSLMPGDTLSIGSELWGTDNQGLWTVDWVGDPADDVYFTDTKMFRVSVTTRTPAEVTGAAALGATGAQKTAAIEGTAMRLLKKVVAITPNQDDETLSDVKFNTDKCSRWVGEASGTIMTAVGKLGFPSQVSRGADGYAKVTGLLKEAIRTIYGDARDSQSYPGYISEGAAVNAAGSLIRRLQFALVLRARTGAPRAEIAKRARSAVASYVNASPVGKPIALQGVLTAASKVYGVEAAAMQRPLFDATHDIIALQPSEKGRVLDVELDVAISFSDE